MLSLCIAFIACCYVLKIFFPNDFIIIISNPRLIKIGVFVNSHKWLDFICGTITSFITYWLYTCAVCGRRNLKWWQNLILLSMYPISEIFMLISVEITSYYSIFAMILIPAFLGAELKRTAFVFVFHSICQLLSISIRDLSAHILCYDFITLLIMTLECYLWLLLFYIRFNYYTKGEKQNGQQVSSVLRQERLLE